MGRLDGKVAIITGGASGMGEATAHLFAREGARIVIGDLQRERAEQVAKEIGSACVAVETDVSAGEDIQRLIRTAIDRFGRLDVMYNNAGIGGGEGLIADCPKAVWFGMKYALPYLTAAGGGSIITTASVSAFMGIPTQGAYGAAKGGVVQLTRVCAIEYADKGIRANCICPGATATPLIWNNPNRPGGIEVTESEVRERFATMQPLGRAGEAQDIANAALWLASDESSFVTGQAIVVDGGWMASARNSGGFGRSSGETD
jgi:NAD(P)-dependent dehydrogenase (short-subunit alcohol dehydrogenase family)